MPPSSHFSSSSDKPRKSGNLSHKREKALKQGLASRKLALECLLSVIQEHVPLDKALKEVQQSTLTAQDKAFTEYLVRLVLKHYPLMKPFISQFLVKPWGNLPKQAQLLLCMATAQIHLMNVPAYAAVDSTVELTKRSHLTRLKGMMNVVLKQVASHSLKQAESDVLQAVPEWLSTRLSADYGEATARNILTHSMADVSVVDITLKDSSQINTWAEKLEAKMMSPATLRLNTADMPLTQREGFAEGAWWVQDMAAALPVMGIAEHLQGKRVLDACAAPGGKTMQLAAYGAHVTALDRSRSRLKRVQENLERTGLTADIICADLLAYEPAQPYDIVVLDAPCSATGTLRRNPDILYHLQDTSIEELLTLQARMLERASGWVKQGGLLLYCTCSLFKAEGEAQIAAFLQTHPAWQRERFSHIPAHLLDEAGNFRSLPFHEQHHGGMDGFFASVLRLEI